MSCPCGTGDGIESCCGPYLSDEALPPTALALMRSRYTAFVVGDMDYVFRTNHANTVKNLDRESTEEWARESTWHGLEILSTEAGEEDDVEGVVEFVANFTSGDEPQRHQERAEFKKSHGRWYYWDGKVRKGTTVVREEPKVGRNDPCPCGSGKKFKKCCGA